MEFTYRCNINNMEDSSQECIDVLKYPLQNLNNVFTNKEEKKYFYNILQ